MPFDGSTPGPGRPRGSKNKLSKERITEEIRRLATLDPARLFFGVDSRDRLRLRKRYTLKEIYEMPPEVRACIASIKVKTENLTAGDSAQDTVVEIKLWDKGRALELAARCLGMLNDKLEITGNADVNLRIQQGQARAAARNKKAE